MKTSLARRIGVMALALILVLGSVLGAGYAAIISAMAAEQSVETYAPNGTMLVSVGADVTISAATNERAGSENSYEMPSETWAKSLLVDGKVGTGGWSTNPYDRETDHTKPVTVTLTLPTATEVMAVGLFACGSFPVAYEIQVSSDGKNFTKVAADSGKGGNTKEQIYSFEAVKVGYVRLHITERSPAAGIDGALAQLGEIAVYGKAETAIVLDRPALELLVGETDKITASFVGVKDNPALTFQSLNPAVVAVAADGTVTAKKLGKTTVTVTCAAIGKSVDCSIEVVSVKHDFNENINISVFWPPTPSYINDEQYKLMADAGITWVMGAGEETLATPQNQRKMLELCAKYGLGMTIQDGNFGDSLLNKREETIKTLVEKYKNVPSAYGFYLRDEPFNPNGYLKAYVGIKKAAPDAYVHLNFLPSGSYGGNEELYKAQMNDWCRLTAAAGYPIEYLMFDRYPFHLQAGSMDRHGFFANTRSCWEVGLANGVKTGMYIQTVQQDVAFRRPSASEIRYEMYAALAFGYKQLSFFTWFTPTNRNEPFSDGIIAPDGTPNEHYEVVKTINHEVLAMGKTLVKCDALEVWFNGRDTYGQPAVPEDFFVQAAANDSVILSFLRHRETGRNYLMVVNNNFSAKQDVELTFDSAIKQLFEVSDKDGSLKPLTMDGQILKLSLAAGDGMLIALPEGFDHYKAPEGQPEASVNLADGALFTSTKSQGADGYYLYYLNDGVRITDGSNAGKGWSTVDNKETELIIDLHRSLDFNRLDIYPCGSLFDYGANFPTDFKVAVSEDGKTFTEVKSFEDLKQEGIKGLALSLGEQKARYIRLTFPEIPKNRRFSALNEIEVYNDDGSVPAPETFSLDTDTGVIITYKDGDNLAFGKEAFASSTTDDGMFKQWGWSLDFINDGTVNNAWTSNVGRNDSANAEEFIGIKFGDIFAVDKVVIKPWGAFPVNYKVELSANGVDWTVIHEEKNAKTPDGELVITPETPVPARFIRLIATKLNFGGNAADGYLLQIGEIEAYGKPVCDKAAIEEAMGIFESNGGDKADALYAEATEAVANALYTQTQANDLIKRLFAAVNYVPETEPETTVPVEPDTTVAEPVDTTAPDGETTASPDAGTTDAGADTGDSADTEPDEKKGCASALLSSTALLLLCAACVTVLRKKD